MSALYDLSARRIDGNSATMLDYADRVLLIVNTASECGFTPQYEGLERLYREYRNQGFSVLGFPCDQFGAQEPGDAGQTAQFCEKNYGVTFPMFAKIDVNGEDAHPLYVWLKKRAPGVLGSERIKWNFTKFLIDRQGCVVDRYEATKPEALRPHIERLL